MPPFEKFLQGLMEDEAKWDEVSIMLITLGRSGCCACFGPPEPKTEPKGFFRMINMRSIRRAIAEAFPQLAIEHIRLDSSGWDNVVAVVNHEIVFRFPRRPEVARTLEIESRLLPELRKVVSLPIPHFEFISQGFVGYRLIPGEPLTKALLQQADSKEARRLAQQLAEFLSELHSFPLERAIELSVPHTPDRDLWTSFYAEIRKYVFPLLAVNERAWARQLFESFLDDERNFQFKPVLLHGDFSPDHILFDGEAGLITGIIDFGDVRIGDPAYDFQWREDFGEQFWRALLNHYKLKIDEGFFRRLEFYERRLPLGEILYGITCNASEHITSGLQALRRAAAKEVAQIMKVGKANRRGAAEELGFTKPTFYFKYRGEVNTTKVLELARQRALELKITKMVVASETGRSALKALDILKGTKIKLIVVTHYPAKTWGPKGDIPIGLGRPEYQHVKRYMEEQGAVIVQGTRPFAGIGRALGWDSPVPATFVDKTLELFSSGTKIAIEAVLMATDAGALNAGEEIVTLGGTYKGLDTALVVKTSYSGGLFSEFDVLEIIAKPLHRGKRLPEYEQEDWRGNLDQYYKPIKLGRVGRRKPNEGQE